MEIEETKLNIEDFKKELKNFKISNRLRKRLNIPTYSDTLRGKLHQKYIKNKNKVTK